MAVNHLNGNIIPQVITIPATTDKQPNKAVHTTTPQRIPLVKNGIYTYTEWT
jgi:hypothetical protein